MGMADIQHQSTPGSWPWAKGKLGQTDSEASQHDDVNSEAQAPKDDLPQTSQQAPSVQHPDHAANGTIPTDEAGSKTPAHNGVTLSKHATQTEQQGEQAAPEGDKQLPEEVPNEEDIKSQDPEITHEPEQLPKEEDLESQAPPSEAGSRFSASGIARGAASGLSTAKSAMKEVAPEPVSDSQAGEDKQEAEQETGKETESPVDYSVLKGGKINKGGNVVDPSGSVLGRVTEGVLNHMIGKKVDENGAIWNDSGAIIGKAEPIPDNEKEEMTKEPQPFESFPDAVVDADGMVVSNGEKVGKVINGDVKALRGKSVDADGDILDRAGNVLGKAELWEPEPEAEPKPEPEVDRSILAGRRVNKAGNVVDGSGVIFGRIVEGDVKRMAGRMCDKNGNVLSESGDVIGKAEVVPEGEREGMKEGPFAELSGCTVTKDGKVVTPGGDVVGRITKGDAKVLFGRVVDEDGDICDKNGNVLSHAERWEEPEVEKKKNPLSGRRVNREGNVVDEDGNLVGKLTSGELSVCAGKEVDDDGDVVDGKGTTIGHVSLLSDIPEPPPVELEESAEDKQKREQLETDKQLAIKISQCLSSSLDRIRPICKMITQKIEKADRTPKEELDEEDLVKEVKPLIEEGGRILTEANGIVRGLDPDGRIQANAKHKTAAREATPEEYHLADVIKELTGTVTECIDGAKRKIEDMPHAKKELNPLWGLLSEPLFQIIAAVGLLLSGVLGIVGRLLNGLGLGGLVDNLLGGLGITKILDSLGVGSLTDSLTGKNQRKGKK